MLLGAALFGRAPAEARAGAGLKLGLAAAAGGLLPDVPSFVLVVSAGAGGMSASDIFETAYFSEPWQAVMAPSHSVPLWGAALLLALLLRSRLAAAFAASGLLHQAGDFPLHADDPHRHFWPLSDWRFNSPVSYWDPARFGAWVQPLEIALGLALVVVLWRRWPSRPVRAGLAFLGLLYGAQALAAVVFLRP